MAKKREIESTKDVKKGHVALFFDGHIISGECRFTAMKTAKKRGDAIFVIHLIKPLP